MLSKEDRTMQVPTKHYLINKDDPNDFYEFPPNYEFTTEYRPVVKSKFNDLTYQERNPNKLNYFHLITEFETNLRERLGISYINLGRMLMLCTYASYRKDGKVYIKTDNNRIASNTFLAKTLKISKDQFKKFKSEMIKKGVLFQNEEGLYFSDDLIMRGKMLKREKQNLTYYRIYNEAIRELFNMFVTEEDTYSVKQLGVLFCLIPYIKILDRSDVKNERRHSNNLLVVSEYNEVLNRYEPMNQTQLAERLGMSRSTLNQDIKKLNKIVHDNTGHFLVYRNKLAPVGYETYKYTQEATFIHPRYTYSGDETHEDYFKLIKAIENLASGDVLPELIY